MARLIGAFTKSPGLPAVVYLPDKHRYELTVFARDAGEALSVVSNWLKMSSGLICAIYHGSGGGHGSAHDDKSFLFKVEEPT